MKKDSKTNARSGSGEAGPGKGERVRKGAGRAGAVVQGILTQQ